MATTANISALITTLYEKRALMTAVPRMPHLWWSRTATFTGNNTYQLFRYSELPAVTNALNEGVTPDETAAPSLTTVTLTPEPYGAWMGYTREMELEAFSPVVSQLAAILGRQAGLSVDTIVRNTQHSGATVDYSGTATARNQVTAVVTYDDVVDQLAELQAKDAVPVVGSNFVCVTHPLALAVLFKDPDFQTLFTREGGEAIRNGMVGRLFNCEFYVTSNARVYTGAGASGKDVYTMLFMGGEAHGAAGFTGFFPNMGAFEGSGQYDNLTGKNPGSPVSIIIRGLGETGFDPLKQRGTIGWLLYFDDVVLNANWIRSFEHAIA